MADEFGGIPVDSGTDEFGGIPVSSAPASTTPPDNGGIGNNLRAGFTEALTSIPDAVLRPAREVYEAARPFLGNTPEHVATGTPIPGSGNNPEWKPDETGHVLNKGLGLIGLNPEDVTANTAPERVARVAGAGATALLAPEAGGEAIAEGVPMAGNVISRAANTPLKTLGRKALTGTAAGLGGGAAEEAVPDEDPVLKTAVGTLAALATGTAAEIPGMVAPKIASGIGRFTKPMTAAGQDQIAADSIRSRATDAPGVLESLDQPGHALVPNSNPTTFQQTGDMGLGSLEREQAAKNPAAFMQRRTDQNAARHVALTGVQSGANPGDVGDFLRSQFHTFDTQTQNHIDALTAHAQQQAEGLGGAGQPDQHGAGIRDALQQAEDTAKTRERSLWQAVDPDNNIRIDATPTFTAAKDIQSGMSRFAAPMEGPEKGIFDSIQGDKQLSLGELSDLRSRVSTAARNELMASGNSPAYARMIRLRGAIQNNLADAATAKAAQDTAAVAAGEMAPTETISSKIQGWVNDYYGNRAAESGAASGESAGASTARGPASVAGADGTGLPEAGGPAGGEGDTGVPPRPINEDDAARLAEATDATKTRAGTFNQGPIKQTLAKAGMQSVYKLPEARVPEKFFHAGPTSPSDIRQLRSTIGAGPANQLLSDYAASSLRRAAESPDGTLDPRKVQAWQRRYGGAMTEFPELAQRFSTASGAGDAIAEATANRRTAIQERNGTALDKVVQATTPDAVTKTIGGIFGSKTATQDMGALVRAASASPEATQGLRQAVADHIAQNFISNTEGGTSGIGLLKSDAYQTFLRKNRAALSQVFKPEEMQTLDAIAADLRRANRSITAVKIPGGSNTAQDVHGIIAHDPNASVFDHALSEAGAAGAGAAVGHLPGAILGGLGAKIANAVRKSGFQKVDDLITEAMLNPDFAKALLRRAPAQEESPQAASLASHFRRVGLGTLATRLGPTQRQGYAAGGRIVDDTGLTVPETLATLRAQQRQLIDGNRKAMLFPKGNKNDLPVPKDMKVITTKDGTFHYNPKKISAEQIANAAKAGRLNIVLSLGPHSKDDVMKRAHAGEKPIAVTERQPDGTEVRAAAGTDKTARSQIRHFERTKTIGNMVMAEHPAKVLRSRLALADGGSTGSEGSSLTPQQILDRNSPWLKAGATGFNTALSPQDETAFRSWVGNNGVRFDPSETTPDYDMRGFYQALKAGDPRATTAINPDDNQTHYPDYWKTPYDATFSKQSQWANDSAPDWQGNKLATPDGTVVWDDSIGGTPAPTPTARPAFKEGGHVHKAAFEADHEPSDAQIKAGNYKHGHVKLHGFDISVETPIGAVRRGVGKDGKGWENYHDLAHYGYLKGPARAGDGEHIDCYIGPYHKSKRIFVANQINPDTQKFDEVKVIFGTRTKAEAKDIYDKGFSDKSGPKRRWSIYEATPDSLKAWIRDGNTKRPFSPLRPTKAMTEQPSPAVT